MKKSLLVIAFGLTLSPFAVVAQTGQFEDMVGTWTWEDFTIKVTKTGPHGISAEVVDGPKNVGLEMIRSEPQQRADFFVARVKHPANGKIYHTKIAQQGPDTWRLDGCTDGGACASGVFKRAE